MSDDPSDLPTPPMTAARARDVARLYAGLAATLRQYDYDREVALAEHYEQQWLAYAAELERKARDDFDGKP